MDFTLMTEDDEKLLWERRVPVFLPDWEKKHAGLDKKNKLEYFSSEKKKKSRNFPYSYFHFYSKGPLGIVIIIASLDRLFILYLF